MLTVLPKRLYQTARCLVLQIRDTNIQCRPGPQRPSLIFPLEATPWVLTEGRKQGRFIKYSLHTSREFPDES